MNAPAKIEADPLMTVWEALCRTDPRHTKRFKRAGGFEGTALKPIWVEKRLTEVFGPCGHGWGTRPPVYTTQPGANNELLVFCNITGWYLRDGNVYEVHGAGGDKIIRYVAANEKYKRPERWESNDEAYKMAMTDATLNAFKHVGVGADIHLGQFDDNKYVESVAREFEEGASNGEPDKAHPKAARGKDAPFPQGPAKNKTELKALGRDLWRDVEACGDDDTLAALMGADDTKALIKQLRDALPDWWDGGTRESGEPFEGLGDVIDRKAREFQLEKAQ